MSTLKLPIVAGVALAAAASMGMGPSVFRLENREPGDSLDPLDLEPAVYRRRFRAPIRHPVDLKKKAARKRQKKARMITRRASK